MKGLGMEYRLGHYNYSILDVHVRKDGKGGLYWWSKQVVTDTLGRSRGDCYPWATQYGNNRMQGLKASCINWGVKLSPKDIFDSPSIIIAEWDIGGHITVQEVHSCGRQSVRCANGDRPSPREIGDANRGSNPPSD